MQQQSDTRKSWFTPEINFPPLPAPHLLVQLTIWHPTSQKTTCLLYSLIPSVAFRKDTYAYQAECRCGFAWIWHWAEYPGQQTSNVTARSADLSLGETGLWSTISQRYSLQVQLGFRFVHFVAKGLHWFCGVSVSVALQPEPSYTHHRFSAPHNKFINPGLRKRLFPGMCGNVCCKSPWLTYADSNGVLWP